MKKVTRFLFCFLILLGISSCVPKDGEKTSSEIKVNNISTQATEEKV